MKTAVTMTKYRWDSSTSPIVRMQKTCRHAIESSSSWQIPSSVAFIENQYEDFAGIKTDGSKPNILFVIEIPFIEKNILENCYSQRNRFHASKRKQRQGDGGNRLFQITEKSSLWLLIASFLQSQIAAGVGRRVMWFPTLTYAYVLVRIIQRVDRNNFFPRHETNVSFLPP